MMKRKVLASWERRAADAHGKIEELKSDVERLRHETEIAQRLLDKAQDDSARETWRIQVHVLQTLANMAAGDLAELQEELALGKVMIAEIEVDLAVEQPAPDHDDTDGDLSFSYGPRRVNSLGHDCRDRNDFVLPGTSRY